MSSYTRLTAAGYRLALLLTASLALAAPTAFADEAASKARVSSSKQIASGGRDGTASTAERQVHAGLVTSGTRAPLSKQQAAASKASRSDFWFYTADVVLFGDDDADGYFYGIDLLFDADTIYDFADVYAVVYLSLNGGPWNEYAVSNTFTVYGASSEDEYVIVTELESGYPTGSYDLLIELYDADTGEYLAEFGPADSAALSYLSLEDYQLDAPYVEEIVVVGSSHGGGAVSATLLLALAALGMRRGRRALRRRRA